MRPALKRIRTAAALSPTVLCLAALSAACWHSVGEIHSRKSFFPRRVSVFKEACCAAGVELAKAVIIGVPIVLILSVVLVLWRHGNGKDRSRRGGLAVRYRANTFLKNSRISAHDSLSAFGS